MGLSPYCITPAIVTVLVKCRKLPTPTLNIGPAHALFPQAIPYQIVAAIKAYW